MGQYVLQPLKFARYPWQTNVKTHRPGPWVPGVPWVTHGPELETHASAWGTHLPTELKTEVMRATIEEAI